MTPDEIHAKAMIAAYDFRDVLESLMDTLEKHPQAKRGIIAWSSLRPIIEQAIGKPCDITLHEGDPREGLDKA